MNRSVRCALVGALSALAVVVASPARAQGPTADAGVEEAMRAVATSDRPALEAALELLGTNAHAPAVGPISARIRRGLPPDLLVTAITTLAVIASPDAGPVLFELARHRRSDVRQAAIDAIVACAPTGASRELTERLGDPDAAVRGTAATAIQTLGARDVIDALIDALAAGVPEAAVAIGAMIDAERVPRVLALPPRAELVDAIAGMVRRADLPAPVRLSALARLESRPSPEVIALLRELAELPDQAIRRESRAMLQRMAP